MAEIGPGETRFIATEEGGISRRMWNDPSWQTAFASKHDLANPQVIAMLLRRAYEDGFADRGVLIRRAIGHAGRLG